MDIVEQHLIPAVLPTDSKSHDVVQLWPGPRRVILQKLVPRKGMRKVGDKHPGEGEAHTCRARHRKNESPTFAQWPTQRPCSQEPNTGPQPKDNGVVLHTSRHPFCPEFLVAFPASISFRETHPPLKGKEKACVIESEEVNHRDPGDSQQVLVPVWPHGSCPLLQCIVELLGVPTELTLDEQVHSACMMPGMLQDELFPRQRYEVAERMRDKPAASDHVRDAMIPLTKPMLT